MSCCAKKILKSCHLVTVCTNKKLLLPYSGLVEGKYMVNLLFLQSVISMSIDAEDGKISIPVNNLNEQYYYEGQLFTSDGVLVPINDQYDAFAFSTTFINADPLSNSEVLDPDYEVVQNQYNQW